MTDKPNYGKNPNAAEPAKEKVRVIPIEFIDEFPNHPFHVNDDEEMEKLMTSIKEIGLQTPIVARIKEDGRYEIVSGHRRLYAMKKLSMTQISAIVRDMTRDEAIIAMVDSNLQREHILPSEKAAAYKMKMEAMKRRAGRPANDNSRPLVGNYETAEVIGEDAGDSGRQVQRYIRLNELVPEILEKVDDGSIAFRPAVELSYLSEDEQRNLVETMDSEEATPSLAQAIRMKQLSKDGKLDMDAIFGIMTEEKPNQVEVIKFKKTELDSFFPDRTPAEIMKKQILKILSSWQRREQAREEAKVNEPKPVPAPKTAEMQKKKGGDAR
ncbi:MAG: ParB/RepB/Spo0J family partition protein [Bacteroidales bacterium]|nr:ParB/RepB/Spo0J family partition protein [Bacteroidales bacterium]